MGPRFYIHQPKRERERERAHRSIYVGFLLLRPSFLCWCVLHLVSWLGKGGMHTPIMVPCMLWNDDDDDDVITYKDGKLFVCFVFSKYPADNTKVVPFFFQRGGRVLLLNAWITIAYLGPYRVMYLFWRSLFLFFSVGLKDVVFRCRGRRRRSLGECKTFCIFLS